MGLSASQARLLSLTARQSNLEYEGQQINQQRTTLSNESSNYYNSLLEMSVPVPPSTNDYTKIVYTFMIGGNEATVKEALPKTDKDGNTSYFVSYTTTLSTVGVQENEAFKTSASSKQGYGKFTLDVNNNPIPINKDTTNVRWDDTQVSDTQGYFLATMNRIGSNEEADKMRNNGYSIYVHQDMYSSETTKYIIGADGYAISEDAYQELVTISQKSSSEEDKKKAKAAKEELKKIKFYREYDPSNNDDAVASKYALSYAKLPNEDSFNSHKQTDSGKVKDLIFHIEEVDSTTEGAKKGFYSYKSSNQEQFMVVEAQYSDAFESAGLDINEYYQYKASSGIRFVKREDVEGNLNNESRTISTSAVATIKVVKENTMANAMIEFDGQGRISTITDEEGHTYTMTATTETDNAAYEDAYNQYEYNQYIYDQRQNEINANIEILQAQDKSLELRLSTLDTQHSAIQTELEAVKKVMSKNIDNSFKTFNA